MIGAVTAGGTHADFVLALRAGVGYGPWGPWGPWGTPRDGVLHMRIAALLILLSMVLGGTPAYPCSNTEARVQSQTTWQGVVTCNGTSCPQNYHKAWAYTCTADDGSNCIDVSEVEVTETRVSTCGPSGCVTITTTWYGAGKGTQACP